MKRQAAILTTMLALGLTVGCDEDNKTPTESVPPAPIHLTQIRVPADQATIQAAIEYAHDGDTIMVAPGRYTGYGNRDISIFGKTLKIVSERGPALTILELGGSDAFPHRGFTIEGSVGPGLVINGFTIRGGYHTQGAAINFRSASPLIRNCIFANNTGTTSGGAVRCKSANPIFQNCTFVRNQAPVGGAVYLIAGSEPTFESCIIMSTISGGALVCDNIDNSPSFICSDLYGNVGGSWTDCIDTLAGRHNNLSVDPRFCNPSSGNYGLRSSSPCLPAFNECGALIGALGESACD